MSEYDGRNSRSDDVHQDVPESPGRSLPDFLSSISQLFTEGVSDQEPTDTSTASVEQPDSDNSVCCETSPAEVDENKYSMESVQANLTTIVTLAEGLKAAYDELADENTQLQTKLDQALTRIDSLISDYERAKKRAREEKEELRNELVGSTAQKLLPILDDFERSLALGETVDVQALISGNAGIYQRWVSAFSSLGISSFDPTGLPFDPVTCAAVGGEEAEGVEGGLVLRCMQRGYMIADKVIRQASVVVSQ